MWRKRRRIEDLLKREVISFNFWDWIMSWESDGIVMVLGWTCAFLILDPHVLGLKSSFGFLCSWFCFIFQFGCFCCLVFAPIFAFVISMKFCLSSLLNLLSLCLILIFFSCNLIMGCSESRCIVEEWNKSYWWYTIGNFICKRGGAGRDGVIPEPALGFKKNLIPVPNPFIKFKPCPIRGGAGRVPEKTRLVAIPSKNDGL